jgi:hypothetical protein
MPSHKRTRSPTPPMTLAEKEAQEYEYDREIASKLATTTGNRERSSYKPEAVRKHHKTTHKHPNWEELDKEDRRGNAGNTRRLKNKKPKKKPKKKKPKKKKDTRKRKASMNARGNKSTPPPRSPPPSPPRKSMTRREILKNPILPKLSRKYKPKKGKFGYM